MLGEHGDKIENAPYIIEPMIDGLKEEQSPAVRLALLTATTKLFFKRPPEVQSMLGRLLNKELSGEAAYQTEPHDRALLYYRLLAQGIDAVRGRALPQFATARNLSNRALGSRTGSSATAGGGAFTP